MNNTTTFECYLPDIEDDSNIPGWRGIPEELVINGLFASTMILILTILRRIYLCEKVNDWNIDWIQFLYGNRDANLLHTSYHIKRTHENAFLPPALRDQSDQMWNRMDANQSWIDSDLVFTTKPEDRMRQKHQEAMDSVGQSRFWLLDYLCVSDEHIYQHRGHDAYQYLLFERYLIYYMVLVTAVNLTVLLPVNVLGGKRARDAFEKTTINALEEESQLLWVHVGVTFTFVLLSVAMMKHYSWRTVSITVHDDRTVMIENVPEEKRNAKKLKRYIEHRFPVEVTQMTLSYNVAQLNALNQELYCIREALKYSERYRKQNGQSLRVTPICCCCCGCCGTGLVDAIEYYRTEEKRYQKLIKDEVQKVSNQPEHVVFVQFKEEQMATRFIDHFEQSFEKRDIRANVNIIRRCCCCCYPRKAIDDSDPFGYYNWIVRHSPVPEDIVWDDIILNTHTWGLTVIGLAFLLFIMFLLMSTPMVALNYLSEIIAEIGLHKAVPSKELQIGSYKLKVTELLSGTVMAVLNFMLPRMLIAILLKVPRVSMSEKNHNLMQTIFVFSFLCGYVLPSIGLVSINLLIKKLFNDSPLYFYKCLFPSESCAWFLKLVIAVAIFNTAYELLRVPDLCFYLFYCVIYVRTQAEYVKARLKVLPFEFSFACNLASLLLLYTIVLTYCVACPLMAPFGLLALALRYLLERYQIYYLCSVPEIITVHINKSAIFIVLFANLVLIMQVAGFVCTNSLEMGVNPGTVMLLAFVLYILFLCIFPWLFDMKKATTTEDTNSKGQSTKNTSNKTSAAGQSRFSKKNKISKGNKNNKRSTNRTSANKKGSRSKRNSKKIK